jgi:hypothetical protein
MLNNLQEFFGPVKLRDLTAARVEARDIEPGKGPAEAYVQYGRAMG